MSSNFVFLKSKYPFLFKTAELAETYLYSDPNSSIYKIGLFAENIVSIMIKLNNITYVDDTLKNKIWGLKKENLLPKEIDSILYSLRKNRNGAVHENLDDTETAKDLLKLAHTFAIWFHKSYTFPDFTPSEYKIPIEIVENSISLKEEKDFDDKAKDEADNTKSDNISIDTRKKNIKNALIDYSEDEIRVIVDDELRKVGWEVDSKNLRYSKGTRPEKGRNLVISEFPTNAPNNKKGYADYAFFIGTKLYALMEAKKPAIDIPAVIADQCTKYATHTKEEHSEYILDTWGKFKVPFIFSTNGKPYVKEFETKSGIWFRDTRRDDNIARALQGYKSPQGMKDDYAKDIEKSNENLANLSKSMLEDTNGLSLRKYQLEAVEAVEKAILGGSNTALLAMATGTGKTRVALGMLYRFLETKRFYRILFLVDRTSLGEQAEGVFSNVKLIGKLTLNDIYPYLSLKENEIDSTTRFQISTVQSLMHSILYNNGDKMPAVSDYDLIIVDEAHRGYTLDKEMTEAEYIYRNQNDFLSKYRKVIDYFDAIKIGITATPAPQTTEIFGKPVFTYSYARAVSEGYLVSHDAPHSLTTKLGEEGIHYKKGDTPIIYDQITGEIIDSEELEDELDFELETFNRKIVVESFTTAVLQEISKYLNPEGKAKTLIYAVDDKHADSIVSILQNIYAEQGVNHEAIAKITGKARSTSKEVNTLVKHFKNEVYPNIAVTVDLLTTGVDVPEISNLVFLRCVKSRILFEQMLGRATRLCPEINKTHFEIFDPVGIYKTLEPISTMKPTVADAKQSFTDIIDSLSKCSSDDHIKHQINILLTKFHRKNASLSKEDVKTIEEMVGNLDSKAFAQKVKDLPPQEAKKFLEEKRSLFVHMDKVKAQPKGIIISDKEDELTSHTRSYGDFERPEDYLEEFNKFIEENKDKIEALKIICTRPSDLTLDSLSSLRAKLDEHNFSETMLNTAWKEAKNDEILADIITFIRSQTMGAKMQNTSDRVANAFKKLKQAHNFTQIEKGWLEKIEAFLSTEIILSEETFNRGQFVQDGGFKKINKFFNNKLSEYIKELNIYLYEDGGKAA